MPSLEELRITRGTHSGWAIRQRMRLDQHRQIRETPREELAGTLDLGISQGAAGSEEVRAQRGSPWYAQVLSELGIHELDWGYVADGDCGQVRLCRRCGNTKTRIHHQTPWQWRYVNDGACQQLKVCRRCTASNRERIGNEARIKHTNEWQYTGKSTCVQIWTCRRCKFVPKRFFRVANSIGAPVGSRHVEVPERGPRTRHEAWSREWEVEGRWWQGEKRAHRCLRCAVVEEWTVNDGD